MVEKFFLRHKNTINEKYKTFNYITIKNVCWSKNTMKSENNKLGHKLGEDNWNKWWKAQT